MTVSIWALCVIFLIGYLSAMFSLAGVALGGYLVFRSKREPHEALFGTVKGEAGAVDEEFAHPRAVGGSDRVGSDLAGGDDEIEWGSDVTRPRQEQTDRFLEHLRQSVAPHEHPEQGEQEQGGRRGT